MSLPGPISGYPGPHYAGREVPGRKVAIHVVQRRLPGQFNHLIVTSCLVAPDNTAPKKERSDGESLATPCKMRPAREWKPRPSPSITMLPLGQCTVGSQRLVAIFIRFLIDMFQLPSITHYNISTNGLTYRYTDPNNVFLPFGSGLSYGLFHYSNLRIDPSSPSKCQEVKVQVEVSNNVKIASDEVGSNSHSIFFQKSQLFYLTLSIKGTVPREAGSLLVACSRRCPFNAIWLI